MYKENKNIIELTRGILPLSGDNLDSDKKMHMNGDIMRKKMLLDQN